MISVILSERVSKSSASFLKGCNPGNPGNLSHDAFSVQRAHKFSLGHDWWRVWVYCFSASIPGGGGGGGGGGHSFIEGGR